MARIRTTRKKICKIKDKQKLPPIQYKKQVFEFISRTDICLVDDDYDAIWPELNINKMQN